MFKRAVILAGGKGTRLKPYTVVLPKPLMPIGDYPILEVIIRQLAYYGFNHITLAVNHQAEIIKAFFGNGSKWKIKIDYSLEDKPLSTMGPLKLMNDLPDDFLVMNGDVLTDVDFSILYNAHCQQKNVFTIAATQRQQVNLYGVLESDSKNNLTGFKEKPVHHFLVSMGVYMVNKKILKMIPENQLFGFDHLMLELIKRKEFPKIIPHHGYWLDIGRPDDYAEAIDTFEEKKSIFLK